jgi:hypothetical protein
MPEAGAILAIVAVGTTVKFTPVLDEPPLVVTITLTVPVTFGTVAVMLALLQPPVAIVAAFVPNFTVPWAVPKLLPAMTTVALTAPELGVRLLILGAAAKALAENDNKNARMMTSRRFFIRLLQKF